MGQPRRKKSFHGEIEPWELDLVQKVARRFRTTEHDDLEAELGRKLLHLKVHLPSGINHWKAYLAKFLYNKADNWVRDSRAREKKIAHQAEIGEQSPGEIFHYGMIASTDSPRDDLRIAIGSVWKDLNPQLRRLWEVLLEEKGNQLRVGRRLGKHRNTVRLWIQKIKQVLVRHGFHDTTSRPRKIQRAN